MTYTSAVVKGTPGNATSPLRAAIYCRISLARFGDTLKVDDQEKLCREVADRRSWRVVEGQVHVDNSRSAWQANRKRPGWDAMLEAIGRREIDAIVVYHGDRLIRQPWDLELLLRLAREKGIRLASPTGERDLDNPDDQFILRIEAAQACREVDNTSRRVKRHLERLAEQGISRNGGRGGRTFGYEKDCMTIHEDEAAVIREVARRLLSGDPISAIARDLNARGYTTTAGGPWDAGNLKKLMLRPRLAGLLARHGAIVGPGAWPAILDRDTWEAVRSVLDRKAAGFSNTSNARRYLLSGIARCSTCGAGLAVRQGGGPGTVRAYTCINSPCEKKVHRSVTYVDAYVEGQVLRKLQDPEIRERATAPDAKPLLDELARLERRREQKLIEFADDDDPLAGDVLRVSIRRIDEQLAEVRGQIAAGQASHALDGLWGISRDEWAALPLARRRSAVQALVRVTVLPSKKGPGFDPETVLVEDV